MKILLVLAHHDDEVRISPLLLQHVLSGDSIEMIVCTRPHKKEIATMRMKESYSAMNLLKQNPSQIHSLNYLDGTLINSLGGLYVGIKNHIEKTSPDLVYVPAFEGGNIDHDAINIVVSKLKNEFSLDVTEFSLYNAISVNPLIPFGFASPFSQSHQQSYQKYNFSEEESGFFRKYFSMYQSQFHGFMLYANFIKQRDALNTVFIRTLQEYRLNNIEEELPIAYHRYSRHTFTLVEPLFNNFLGETDNSNVQVSRAYFTETANRPIFFYLSHAIKTVFSKE